MMQQLLRATDPLAAALVAERPHLMHLCARLSGSPAAAEDLAQETLLEAWRHAGRLTDPEGAWHWLAAVARNVCLRWRRAHGRDAAHLVPLLAEDDAPALELMDPLAEEADFTLELERDDLARLLDRALAALPADTRQVLIARCIEEQPQAEAAARLGLSEGALAVRLHRGKLALRRVLEGELRDEAAALGMPLAARAAPDDAGWSETRIWCLVCGRRRLRGYLNPAAGELILRCPACDAAPDLNACHHVSYRGLFDGVSGHKAAFNRVLRWGGPYYRDALRDGHAICQRCWQPAPLRLGYPEGKPDGPLDGRGFHVACARCDYPQNDGSLAFLILAAPEGRRFWRDHPRLRQLPEREVESQGRAAVVAGFESVSDGARLEVVSDRATLDVFSIHMPHTG